MMDFTVPDKSKSSADGAIAVWNAPRTINNELQELLELADKYEIRLMSHTNAKEEAFEADSTCVPGMRLWIGWFCFLAGKKKYKMHVRHFCRSSLQLSSVPTRLKAFQA
jgi:hypothetical protein